MNIGIWIVDKFSVIQMPDNEKWKGGRESYKFLPCITLPHPQAQMSGVTFHFTISETSLVNFYNGTIFSKFYNSAVVLFASVKSFASENFCRQASRGKKMLCHV